MITRQVQMLSEKKIPISIPSFNISFLGSQQVRRMYEEKGV